MTHGGRQFYEFSSRNKPGNRPHPIVLRRREQILNMWWEHRTIEEIAVTLDLHEQTVHNYLQRARQSGDDRAKRQMGVKRLVQAQARRKQIIELAAHDYSPAEIARQVGCHLRLVQMRLREASHAIPASR